MPKAGWRWRILPPTLRIRTDDNVVRRYAPTPATCRDEPPRQCCGCNGTGWALIPCRAPGGQQFCGSRTGFWDRSYSQENKSRRGHWKLRCRNQRDARGRNEPLPAIILPVRLPCNLTRRLHFAPVLLGSQADGVGIEHIADFAGNEGCDNVEDAEDPRRVSVGIPPYLTTHHGPKVRRARRIPRRLR